MSLVKKLFFETQWNIGWTFINTDDLSDIDHLKNTLGRLRFLEKGRYYFIADPFIVDAERKIIIAEYYHFFKGYSELAVLHFDEDDNIVWLKKLPSESKHYSYPFILKDRYKTVVFPESSQDGCQKMIELDKNNFNIIREKEIISPAMIVDPTVFKLENSYLLFANPLSSFNEQL